MAHLVQVDGSMAAPSVSSLDTSGESEMAMDCQLVLTTLSGTVVEIVLRNMTDLKNLTSALLTTWPRPLISTYLGVRWTSYIQPCKPT